MTPELHEFWVRLKALFHKRHMDREMAEELEFHQAMLRNKLLRQGVPPESVDGATRRAFGDSERWHERLRELWQFRALENLSRDIRFSMRLLRKSPGFHGGCVTDVDIGSWREYFDLLVDQRPAIATASGTAFRATGGASH